MYKDLKSSKSSHMRRWKHKNKCLILFCHDETLLFGYTAMSLMSCDFKVAHFKSSTVHTECFSLDKVLVNDVKMTFTHAAVN